MTKEGLLAFWLHISVPRYKTIIALFGSLDNFWQTQKSDLQKLKWPKETLDKFIVWRDSLDEQKCENDLKKANARIITIVDPDYPPLLAAIFDPPYTLFVQGQLKNNQPLLAVVGTRQNTFVGKQIIEKIVEPFAKEIGIVSGLAYGIDSFAHQAALNVNAYTIAVLGAGFDSNELFAERKKISEQIIASGGAVITEYPPGTASTNYTFPKRNRIISGLAKATLVIEAGIKSGALITASCALEQGREVLAVPHSIFSLVGVGPNNLIKDGATIITSVNDLRAVFNLNQKKKSQSTVPISSNPIENIIMAFLANEPQTGDAIVQKLNLPAHHVAVLLTEMEIKGMIQAILGNRYICS
ncbi:MAG: DNA protecting protein DprA [Candidatus Magasanikbacteria bacterium RIFCSPHIGHO2_01_FULL_41_23]|uniref:DNA protecting protein DprA n=1 Tax=Candidatus Magasanikbacteria bacterium RIFCSPLOWO2_01_FULL_40_15 TaxID=1798686 RepID=A0A1F6N2I7_9BACT|nr:MAG: DNA protecting protein DprA [Candidatus Magasanikbacteria bacterium RIFCSPHIGHO2_01_FULL_41_23]OGH66859.1 MAG: DNA protecting protein DprA [Candidatus Magasanikbacteria bacterium RIFCSPHIGHO2_02_FULL_41_35]OGH74842.1 MAG: DNA protecting protein DprA [Candidatus Magasanikbacteria bacterium RIFCSPHIGHO2_12_FULL_41_16]OGH78117.1 MAG: DNA protecting protein DprA [Candidatus Magasanikbacteria bacterium RIFCSPLOWO2_01_FULL_40_15]